MILIPAIDIKEGKVIRLRQGQFDQVTEYSQDPLQMAHHWVSQGARMLHVVDLDGAQSGESINRTVIKQIAKEVDIPVETGGGIRSMAAVDDLLQSGMARVILGTRVVEDREFLDEALQKWDDRIAVSLDCADGFVAQRGWVETSTIKGVDLARDFVARGLKYIIYTDIATDGMLSGPNIEGLKELLDAVDVHVIASGGIKDLNDIQALLDLQSAHLWGAITGRAIYEGTLDLQEALKLCY